MSEEKERKILTDKNEVINMLKAKESFKDYRIEGIRFYNDSFDYPVDFSNAELHNVSFENANFGTEEQSQPIIFRHAKFSGKMNFDYAEFFGSADFENTTFLEGAGHFWNAKFFGMARFDMAQFQGESIFIGAEFHEIASFLGTKFSGDVIFDISKFYKQPFFVRTEFTGKAAFVGTEFADGANFELAEFYWKVYFRYSLFPKHKTMHFTDVNFTNPEDVYFKRVYLGKASFKSTDLSGIRFTDVKWKETGWWLWHRKCLYDELTSKKSKDFALVEELYSELKLNYEGRGDFSRAGDFHYGELEMKRFACRAWWSPEWWLYTFYKLLSGYGEHWGQSIVILMVISCIFAWLQLIAGFTTFDYKLTWNLTDLANPQMWSDYGKSILFTMQNAAFFDSSFEPSEEYGSWLALLARIMLSTQAALMVLAIRRKFQR